MKPEALTSGSKVPILSKGGEQTGDSVNRHAGAREGAGPRRLDGEGWPFGRVLFLTRF